MCDAIVCDEWFEFYLRLPSSDAGLCTLLTIYSGRESLEDEPASESKRKSKATPKRTPAKPKKRKS